MQCLIILLLCCLLKQTSSRPQANQENYKDADVAEYESDDGSPEDSPPRYEDAVVDDKISSNKEEDEVIESHPSRNYFFKHYGANRTPEERTTKENANDNFSDFKSGRHVEGPEDETADNEQDQPALNGRYDRYSEANSANKQSIRELDHQEDNSILRKLQLFKRRDSAEHDENSHIVDDNNGSHKEHVSKNDKNKRNYDNPEPIGQSNFYHNYYNKPLSENRESEDDPYEEIEQEDSNRGRRDANDPDENNNGNSHDTKNKKDIDNFENEAEQAIIQRYVKKLSKKEVEDLMKTLSDDKRAILEQIIDNDGSNQEINLNKREITKKAEAVEENNLMDGVQSDSSKNSGPLMNFNLGNGITKNVDSTGVTPAADDNFSSTKPDESKINKRSTDGNEDAVSDKLENRAVTTRSTESVMTKSENKREVNFIEPNNEGSPDNGLTNEPQEASIDGLQEESYVQDEDLTQLLDDDAQLHYDDRNPQKRDLKNNEDIAEPMKSLQESFSDSNNYENSGYYGDSNMPLIRVKRKNNEHAVKKRAAAILPDNKVAYVPENEDEDNDEGNEIYDDGFFDRTANFAKSKSRGDKVGNSRERVLKWNADDSQTLFKRSSTDVVDADDVAQNSMSIGSDTDSVLSGVEGVDENLMYKGGCRKKRAVEKNTKLEPVGELIKFDMLSNASRSSLVGDTDRPETFGVSFNSNDAFGSPSKSCDGELGRYKRIRRLKQQSAVKRPSSAITEENFE